jgi:acyl-CoA thioesterase-1
MRKILVPLIGVFSLLAVAAQAGSVRISAFGDSLVQGYGLVQGQGFVPQLQNWLINQGRDVVIVNSGVSGDTTAGGAERVDWALEDQVTGMIVVLGGNDLLRGLDPADARANLERIVTTAKSRGVSVMLIGMQAPGNYGPDYKAEFDAIYPELAETYDLHLFDSFFAGFADVEGDLAALGKLMQPDGIHPNADGVAKLVEAMGPSVLSFVDSL